MRERERESSSATSSRAVQSTTQRWKHSIANAENTKVEKGPKQAIKVQKTTIIDNKYIKTATHCKERK